MKNISSTDYADFHRLKTKHQKTLHPENLSNRAERVDKDDPIQI